MDIMHFLVIYQELVHISLPKSIPSFDEFLSVNYEACPLKFELSHNLDSLTHDKNGF